MPPPFLFPSLTLTPSMESGKDHMEIPLMVTLMLRIAGKSPPDCLWRDTEVGTTSEAERKGIISFLGTTLRNVLPQQVS